jgi:aspartyl-tRNA(Asn)/glutamyl-tRNA(Gln) amidotransferase subunit A
MIKSNSYNQKFKNYKDKIDSSSTNSVVRTRFDSVKENPKKLLSNKFFLIKDNISIAGEELTCSSKILEGYIAPYNATVISKIEQNGGSIIGQTNMDEFAMGSSSSFSKFGPVKNYYNNSKVAGGSSGGSANAVAEGLCNIALGSDTGGSVRQPASFCGIYGLKPTYGRVSRYGLVAHASSFDTIGILSKNLEEVIDTFSVIAGYDPNDSTSVNSDVPSLKELKTIKLPKKVGVLSKDFLKNINPEIFDIYFSKVKKINELGIKTSEIELPYFKYCLPTYYILTMAEASSNLSRFDGIRYGNRQSDEDLNNLYFESRSLGFLNEVKRRIMSGTFILSSGFYDAYFSKACKVRRLIKNSYDMLFEENDALFIPTTTSVAHDIDRKNSSPVEAYLADIFTVTANLCGIPALNIPAGFSKKENLPFGLQILSNSFKEETLFSLAHLLKE